MVFVNLNLILVACAAAAAVAAPVNDDSAPVLVPRAEVSVFMCTDRGFRGDCMNDIIQTGSCYNVRSEFIDRISSIRNNDRDRNTCTWYRERECRGDSYRNQDDSNLGDGNGRFNDAIRSYECRRK
ncbi:hypothetical protein CGMCC3_g11917 [Colletotrichum fructicola]|uniref:Beta gamma crystallin n=1 Tax=Colletotrichum fructicola (strain Nara gc5) TaxID=1213859 RepID=A0A7J6IVA2_COLFN|nr:uncharacterized protein CGMCC3_g11917 [Colletotrichum fructicola]KAE9572052.1 hypothetical protein CGMCC3_g11917 [Colletotrichum fructicola]KAF4432480.1 hypothetical protein CFRS1_v013727 [Colletotrichum fructicola]KAF4480416.1 hypothetical protein CGGC5_v010354 [Colletotrichum fructicola Nara gc5]KAF4897088.1 hypothetical protein CGCFRS4_v005159 [Colletotrichum fructicola]